MLKKIKKQLENIRQESLTDEDVAEAMINSIDKIPEDIQLVILKSFGSAIQYMNNPSKQAQIIAISNDPYNIEYIKNPCQEAILLAKLSYDYA